MNLSYFPVLFLQAIASVDYIELTGAVGNNNMSAAHKWNKSIQAMLCFFLSWGNLKNFAKFLNFPILKDL